MTKADGKATFSPSLEMALGTLANGSYSVEVRRAPRHRSLSQNALMWKWYQCLEDTFDTPKEDFHELFKARFLSQHRDVAGQEVTVTGSTATLTQEQFTAFLNRVQAFCATEWGITLPNAQDAAFEEFCDYYR